MNGLSLFSGIGGMDLGLERAGIRTVGQVEIDPWCRCVLARHWPDVPRHDDVRTAADWWLSEERPHVDVVFGGFPCQDISNAGRRAGIGGKRSGLWTSFADVIRQLRPPWVLLENVAAVLTRGAGEVLGDLAKIGYDAEWDCIPAAAIGAPHLRDRWFAVAYPQRQQLRLEPVAFGRRGGSAFAGDDGATGTLADTANSHKPHEPPSGQHGLVTLSAEPGAGHRTASRDPASGDRGHRDGATFVAATVADTPGPRWVRSVDAEPAGRAGTVGCGETVPGGWREPGRVAWWDVEPDVGRVAHGVPSRVDRLRGLGNAVVPQVAEHIGRLIGATA